MYEDVGSVGEAGSVVVLRGSGSGLTAAGAAKLRQGAGGVASNPGGLELFGWIVATGDVNGDGRDDLVILVRSEDDASRASAVHVMMGSADTLFAPGGLFFDLADLGVRDLDPIEGMTLSDFNSDGFADLALSLNDASRLAVLHGHADGLHLAPLPETATPGVDAVRALGSVGKDFATLAAGDLTGDGYPDLAVEHSGPISVILGTASGLGPAIAKWPVQGDDGGLAVLPFSGGSHAWLAVGRTWDSAGAEVRAGSVTVLQGTAAGAAGPVTVWTQDSPGIKGKAEGGDLFGTQRRTW
jgi:broad specificity phosphatase PhoE